MANFQPAFEYMIRNEDLNLIGAVTPEPNGGKARFGINSSCHPEVEATGFYEMDRDLALEYAQSFYMKEFWVGTSIILIEDQRIATKLLDIAVHMGNGGEFEVFQTALGVPVTHKLDEATKEALLHIGPEFMDKLVSTLKAHYQAIYDKHPDKYKKYIKGWMNRASKVPD